MNKFNTLYNKLLFEELNMLPTTDTILPKELCNPNNCYKWIKGKANVYACLITDDNYEIVAGFLHRNRENTNTKPQIGKYLVYNPNIAEQGGQVWMNKLAGYSLATPETSEFESLQLTEGGLKFNEYVFLPKENIEEMEEGTDFWTGFQIPEGMTFTIPQGCGNNGADGSTAFATDWLPIVNGKFDWARSLISMKQSNFKCIEKVQSNITPECLNSWSNI